MTARSHDLILAILVVLVFALISLPTQFGLTYWADSPWAWAIHLLVGTFLGAYVLFAFLQSMRHLLAPSTGADAADEQRRELRRRRLALAVLGVMLVIWLGLTGVSFVSARGRPDPGAIRFLGQDAVAGKRVFQAYNCMGCHTIVGNGAYFAPDLTRIHDDVGPAWLMAFLSAAGTWPPEPLVSVWIDRLHQQGALDVTALAAYYDRYPGARKRVLHRGGQSSLMPNLAFTAEEIPALAAFLHYASRLPVAGWPPRVHAEPRTVERVQRELWERGDVRPAVAAAGAAGTAAAGAAGAGEREGGDEKSRRGERLALELGCLACHSPDGSPRVGPSFKGLAGTQVPLATGQTVLADEPYVRESILAPEAKVVKGFQPGVMPPFAGRVSEEQLEALVAYVNSLR
jgi:mono/diheme cytochrome c family protein